METAIYVDGQLCPKIEFGLEEKLEKVVFENSKMLFGHESVLLKRSAIKTETIGNSIPDAFLFDLSDPSNPQFYLVEIELESHNFSDHIFPQITRFVAFFKSSENRKLLIRKLFEGIEADEDLKKQFKGHLGSKEIFKCLTDAVENSQNILLILDGDKPEIAETQRAYDEWARLVRVEVLTLYKSDNGNIFALTPPFEGVEIPGDSDTGEYSENFHLEAANSEVKETYELIKNRMLKFDKNLRINPQKYYISLAHTRNFAFITVRKTKLRIVVTLPFNRGKKSVKKHEISKLSKVVQKFYNSPCFTLTVEGKKNIGEVIQLLKLNYSETLDD